MYCEVLAQQQLIPRKTLVRKGMNLMKRTRTLRKTQVDHAGLAIERNTGTAKTLCSRSEQITTDVTPKLLRSAQDGIANVSSSISFRLDGILPSGKNAVIVTRSGHRFPQKRFVEWRTKALKELRAQCDGFPQPIRQRLTLLVDYTPGDLRTRDVAGMMDAICHLLERSGLIENDGLIRDCLWHEFPMDRKYPQAIVTLRLWEERI